MYLVGTSGVGKTSVCKEISLLAYGYKSVSASEIMMHVCGVSSREELNQFIKGREKEIFETKYLPIIRNSDNLIIANHILGNFRIEIVEYDYLVYLTSKVEDLLEFRKLDSARERSLDCESIRKELLDYELKFRETCKNIIKDDLSIPVLKIVNTRSKTIKEIAERIIDFAKLQYGY